MENQIEIISSQYLAENPAVKNEIREIAGYLNCGLGWHYLLDLIWIIGKIVPDKDSVFLDAGGGLGVLQWWLALKKARVISVDKMDRSRLPRRFRAWCKVQGQRELDLLPLSVPGREIIQTGTMVGMPIRFLRGCLDWMRGEPTPSSERGKIILYNQDLENLTDIPTGSVDVIVSVSALEHNHPTALRQIVQELMRTLRPGGKLVATLSAAAEKDWFHQPSKGWCYTEQSLREAFGFGREVPSNYDRYDKLFESLKECRELRNNLSWFYFLSGKNGMPWGVWNPRYQPVGIVKTKKL